MEPDSSVLPIKKRRLSRYKVCPHCKNELNLKKFKDHRRLFYDPITKLWTKEMEHAQSSESEFSEIEEAPNELDEHESDWDTIFNEHELSSPKAVDEETVLDVTTPDKVATEEGPEYWEESDSEIDADVGLFPNIAPHDISSSPERPEQCAIVKWIVFLLMYFQTKFSVTDVAIRWLLKFLCVLFKVLSKFSSKIYDISSQLPKTLHGHNFTFQDDGDSFEKRAVCKGCNSLYKFGECVSRIQRDSTNIVTINLCSYKPIRRSSRRCGELLMKKIVSCSGHTKHYPHSIYCFANLISCLQTHLLRPGFIQLCESTRSASQTAGYYDVYDGSIWKEFKTYAGSGLLSAPYNYALLLNVDWLQPFEHLTYSVGVIIYMVILNLPRSIRFKRENVMLLGVIPGPNEPSLNINSYLSPIVSDLLDLWRVVSMRLSECTNMTIVRCALIGVSCDLPAARKVCGFLSHSANLGCSLCYTEFSKGFGSRNYSNLDRNSWKMRTNSQHRSDVTKINGAKTKTERARLESQYGCRYSTLLDLPYFDPVHMLLVDPMHNLFLGTAKHLTLDILIGRGILSKDNLDRIEQRLKSVEVPTGVGRLPTRIDVGKFLTAEQWKSWTIYFSIYCLHDLIPNEHLECWRHFVLACRYLCKFHLTSDDITIADALLLKFCKRVCQIYGANALTPNFHMHCHLASCIKGFGPLHSFWLFPFERYNGILGSQPTNNRSVEAQFMRRFQRDNSHLQMIDRAKSWPFSDTFLELISCSPSSIPVPAHVFSQANDSLATPGTKSTLCALSGELLLVLRQLYSILYPEHSHGLLDGQIDIPTLYRKHSYITWTEHRLKSCHHTGTMNPYILATPIFKFSSSTNTAHMHTPTLFEGNCRPAKVQYFLFHSIVLPSCKDVKHNLLACCSWPLEHPKRFALGKPAKVWCNDLFEPSSVNAIIPVSSFVNRVIISIDVISEEHVLITIPL